MKQITTLLSMRQLLTAITLVLAVTVSALAQTTAAADFSGPWVNSASRLGRESNPLPGGCVIQFFS